MSGKSTENSVNTYFKLIDILSNIIYYSQCLSQNKTILDFFHIVIDFLANPTVSTLKQVFYSLLSSKYF